MSVIHKMRAAGPGTEVIEISGEVDMETAEPLRSALIERITSGLKQVVVDMTAVTFIDSSGLGALQAALLRARALGVRLDLVVSEARLRRIFTISGLDREFSIHETEEAALAAT
ncbi:MAG TPA: STAS domain-containing protein [Candidatus Nitrosotenuis sp.]|jgi:anti-sigma B factor antagonist|nr:STAS domain-containing protein [Candidatus Nitrosotenuis sp.]